ncbi:MAG: hypothetical protein ACFE94_18805 [Candidatus Hodarchaeota archaeon]
MSSHAAKAKVFIFPSVYNETEKEDSINFDEIIIPFSKFGKSQSTEYIYCGDEKTKFNERHPIYRKVLLNEFQ